MRWRMYVEGTEIDVPDDLSAQFTYAIDDIKDFAARNTSFSKTVVLPGSTRNNKAFGHIFQVGSGNFYSDTQANIGYNFNAAKGAKAIATIDNIVVFKGVLRLMEIVIDKGRIEYETALFGELGGLVAAMGDKKLEELDFSEYDHTMDLSSVNSSWSITPGAGVYYPLIDYGYTADGKTYPIETFRPALHVKEYVDKIFKDAGYTYESVFMDTNYFKRLIIPFNGIYPAKEVSTLLHATVASYNWNFHTPGGITFGAVPTNNVFFTTDNKRFFYNRPEKLTGAKITMSFAWGYPTAGITIQVSAVPGQGNIYGAGQSLYVHQMTGLTTGTVTLEATLDFEPYTWYEFVILYFNAGSTFLTLSGVTLDISGQPTLNVPLTIGDDVSVSNMIPKGVLQRDFLSSIVKMFNLYIDEDKVQEKHLIIEPFYQYYDPVNRVYWDEKIDRDQPVRLRPMGEMNARTYEYKYKDDSDYFNDLYKKKYGEAYGTFIYDSGFEFVKEKQSIELIFSPTPLVGYSATDRVVSAIYKKSTTTQERTASNIRILLRSVAPLACTDWTLTYWIGNTYGTSTVSSYPYAGHLDDPDAPSDDLCFGVPKEFYFTIVAGYLSANLFNVFWSFYISEITDKDSKLLTAFVKLNPIDIYNLDFSKLVYIAGALWRLNKIEDWDTAQPALTKCELLKVIDVI